MSRRALFLEGTLLILKASTLYIEDIITILEILVENIFVVFAGKVFQQIVGSPMVTNCAHFLTDIILYSYEAEITRLQALLSADKKKKKKKKKKKNKQKRKQHSTSVQYSHIDTSTKFYPLIIQTVRIILVRCVRQSLRSMTRRRLHCCILLGFIPIDQEINFHIKKLRVNA